MRKANVLVAVGAALVVLGIGLAWAVGRDTGTEEVARTVPVVVAVEDLQPGQAGEDLVATGKVEVRQVAADEALAGALSTTAELDGTIIGAAVAEGRQVVAAGLRSSVLRGAAIDIPEGLQAVAVTVPFTAGVAGYAGPGDLVNIYTSVAPDAPGSPDPAPRTLLLATNVEVLDVSDEVAPRRAEPVAATDAAAPTAPARSGGDAITFLLAVDAEKAEEIVFASTNDELWLTLVPEGGDPATTPGAGYGSYPPVGGAS